MKTSSETEKTETVVMDCGDLWAGFTVVRDGLNGIGGAKFRVCDVGVAADGTMVRTERESIEIVVQRDCIDVAVDTRQTHDWNTAEWGERSKDTCENVLCAVASGYGCDSELLVMDDEVRAFVEAVVLEANEWRAWKDVEEAEGAGHRQPSMTVERVYRTLLRSKQDADDERRLARR